MDIIKDTCPNLHSPFRSSFPSITSFLLCLTRFRPVRRFLFVFLVLDLTFIYVLRKYIWDYLINRNFKYRY